MQESRIDDYWNIDGSRDLSDSWTGFTQFNSKNEKPPDGWPNGMSNRRRRRVPNLRVCKHPDWRVAHARERGMN